jgi:hypothetical protein
MAKLYPFLINFDPAKFNLTIQTLNSLVMKFRTLDGQAGEFLPRPLCLPSE